MIKSARLITFDDHPSNAEIFNAESLIDAFWKAEAAFCKDGIQAAIWNTSSPEPNWAEELDSRGYRNQGYLDDIRLANVKSFSEVFEDVSCGALDNYKATKADPHYDNEGNPFYCGSHPEPSKLFLGAKNLKVLCVRNGPGTWIYESEENLNPWQVNPGSYLFFMRTTEVRDKALFHSWPEFIMPTGSHPRVVDCYNLYGLKPECRPEI